MSKIYVSVSVEGASEAEVRAALSRIVGPLFGEWSQWHLFGIHVDVVDMSSAYAYGAKFEADKLAVAEKTEPEVVDVDLFARSDLDVRELQVALAHVIAREIAKIMKKKTVIYDRESEIQLASYGAV